jgi:hypothetical protein
MYPDSFIRTRVDIDKLTVVAFASVNKKWVDVGLVRDIFPSAVPVEDPVSQAAEVMECGESQNVS